MTATPPPGIDVTTPSVARIYDFFLGGKDNYEADRAAAQRLIEISPDVHVAIRANRAFLRRAVRHAARAGIRQFLDLGSGLPTQGNVHELADAVSPGSRVVYVDNDPIVAAHGRALLVEHRDTVFVQADLRRPAELLNEKAVRAQLDFDRPVAVLLAAVLHFVPDEDDPLRIVTTLRDATVPGSMLVLSHGTADPFPERGESATEVSQATTPGLSLRGRQEIHRFFDGYELAEPGLVYAPAWKPEDSAEVADPFDAEAGQRPEQSGLLAGVGVRR
jgi:O-methyltransferase involved in polyketide biosynthesis